MLEFEREDLINSLVIYGLTPVQAQIYITLLKLGRSTAKSISINSDINRVDVYRALKRLSKSGLIEQSLGNPIEFAAVEPDQALDILVEAKSTQIERLRLNKTSLEKRLELIAFDGPVVKNDRETEGSELFVNVLYGEHVFRRLKTMITNSKIEVMTVFSPRSLILYDRIGVPEIERERTTTGVSIRAVTSITKENYKQAISYSKMVNFRHSDRLSSHLRYTIVDSSLLLLPVGEPPTNMSQATALWTDSKALIAGLIDDFEKLWSESVSPDEGIARFQTGM